MIEGIAVGIIQGITEWIPISSEGMIMLAEVNFFGKTGVEEIIHFALFLHLGTLVAALVYLRKDISKTFMSLVRYSASSRDEKNVLHFLLVSTAISGVLGLTLLKLLGEFEQYVELSGRTLTAGVGVLLLFTAWLQIVKKEEKTLRSMGEVTLRDSIILGIAQGLAVLPGLSRSGLTISALLIRGIEDEAALRLSFLMSIPIVFLGNIVLNFDMLRNLESASTTSLWGLVSSFIFGLATIHLLIKFSRKIKFGYFVGFFGLLMVLASFV